MTLLLAVRWVRRGAIALVLVVLVVLVGTAFRVWQVARSDSTPRSDAIVVMGASQFDGRPSAVFQARLEHAKTLYDRHVAPRIVTVGGGRPGDRFTEADAGARWLRSQGVPSSALLPVGQGSDTLQSIKAFDHTARDNGWKKAVIVTDPWHSLRCRRIAQDLGID